MYMSIHICMLSSLLSCFFSRLFWLTRLALPLTLLTLLTLLIHCTQIRRPRDASRIPGGSKAGESARCRKGVSVVCALRVVCFGRKGVSVVCLFSSKGCVCGVCTVFCLAERCVCMHECIYVSGWSHRQTAYHTGSV